MEAATDPFRLIRYGILKPKVKNGGSVRYIEVKDLVGNSLEGKALHLTSHELDDQFKGARLESGDLVIAVRGSYERVALVPESLTGVNISRDVARLAPGPSFSPKFIMLWLQTSISKSYLNKHARGVAVKGVNIATLRAMPVPVLGLELQEEIASVVDYQLAEVKRLEIQTDQAALRARSLRKAVLAAAFSGRLTGKSSDMDLVEEMTVV
ncbi:hypothetical protein Acsp02_60350 [Actinoplanes sp. NBRC 103695]|nr:hypothetical protein Acsp02_60350 [Actinoplanes sp. NBRC 103695]